MLKKTITTLAIAAGMIGATAIMPTGTANAFTVYQGDDYATHSSSGNAFTICDVEGDSHSVWAGYYTTESSAYLTAPVYYPPDPAGTNCTPYRLSSPYLLSNLRVVEDNPNSSTNFYGPWHGYPVAGN
jgi:hypothetical protein